MSMHPYFYWHQNSNNIEIVPSVSENANNAGNIYLPACEQQVAANCVLPGLHENNVVINYGNVHFSGCVDTPNYICNSYIPEVINRPHGILSHSYSNYSYYNNQVDLSGLNYQNPAQYSTCTRNFEGDIKLFDYDYTENRNKETYSYEKDYNYQAILPPVSNHIPYYDNCVTPASTMPVDIKSTKSRMIKNYTKYDDLRDIIEERHTHTRVESNISNRNKQKEQSRDLKHLLRRSRAEKLENITTTEDERDQSIHRELVKNNMKLKRTIQDIQKAKNSLSKLKNSSKILDRQYTQKSFECNPGLLERKTLSKAQKSNLSPDALKRYLAYQRFLRNCYKSPSSQKIHKVNKTKDTKDKHSSQVKEKPQRILKRENKSETVKSTNSNEEIKTKEKSNRKLTSHVNQRDRKEHSKSKLTTYTSLKSKKEESKKKVADSADKKVKKDISRVKQTLDIEEKRKRDERNEKLAKYLEKKRKRQEIKERLFGCDERKKEKTESVAKLLQYLKQNRKQTTKSNGDNKTSSSDSLNNCEDNIDLRTVLTRKRTKNPSLKESKRIKTTKSQQENVTITVKQDMNNKSEPAKITHTTSKVKTIKTKRIKLVINIVCPNSAPSDDSDQTTKDPCTSPHQDLSFLDDFNVDEIVDSLDVSSTQTPLNEKINAEDCHNTHVSVNENECIIGQMSKDFTNMSRDNNNPLLHDNSLTQEDQSNMAPIIDSSNNNVEQQIEDCHNQQSDCTPSCEENKDEQIINISDETEIKSNTPNVNMVSRHREKVKGEQIINISNEPLIDATIFNANIVPRHCEKENDKQIINISDEKTTDTISSIINVDTVYCDDVYEVIDISEDAHINTKVITDIIDLDSSDHHDNINFMIKSSENLNTAGTILQESDKVIQNLKKSNDLKDNIDTSSKIITTINLVTQSIEPIPFIHEIENTSCEDINIPTQQKIQQDNANIENINTVEEEPVLFEANVLNSHNIVTNISTKNIDKENTDLLKIANLATQENKNDIKSNILSKSDTDKDSVLIVKSDKAPSKISGCQITVKKSQDNGDEQKCIKMKSENIKQSQAILERSEINNVNMMETKSDKIKIIDKPDEPVKDTTVTNTANTKTTKLLNDANNENRIRKPTNNIQPDKTLAKPVQNQITSVAKSISNVANNIVSDSKVVKNKQTVKAGQSNAIITPKVRNYVRGIEKRMSEYLNTKFSITEIVHRGYFSSIYKCRDPVGKTYALKVVQLKYRSMAIYRDKILMDLQKSANEDNYVGILRMLESFNSSGEWCFLSEFYPKNLKQALLENGKCFHIDRVQILARQLVAAVIILTNNQIIHADIKPSHILLNSTNERLKLCSFDRSDYNYNIRIIPSSGTASYRAPEMILGYDADYRIDVWSTALVMYEMATNIKLFPGRFNNDILYKQLCTLGPLNYDMLENCTLQNMHFLGSKFLRQLDNQKWVFVQFSGINNKLRHKLFTSYNRDWRSSRTQWQITEDLDKIEILYKLLKQMLTMDPRHRLPITYVQANEFIYDYISDRAIQ